MFRPLVGMCVLLAVSAQVSAHGNREHDERANFKPNSVSGLDVLGFYTAISSGPDWENPTALAVHGSRAIVVQNSATNCARYEASGLASSARSMSRLKIRVK